MKPECPYCGNEMTLVTLPPQFPRDLTHRYTCLRCGAEAPKGAGEQDAYRKATHVLVLGKCAKEYQN